MKILKRVTVLMMMMLLGFLTGCCIASDNLSYGGDSTVTITRQDLRLINARLIEIKGLKEKVTLYEDLTNNMQEEIDDLKYSNSSLEYRLEKTSKQYAEEKHKKKIWRNSALGLAGVIILVIII